jgi:purine-binding chemotaxis protein CheW
MTTDSQRTGDYLLYVVAGHLYALPYHKVVQIIDRPVATRLPNSDSVVRGAINHAGEMVILYDLRKALGRPSLAQEVADTVRSLAQRRHDHVNWLTRLKDEVYHGREITVQTDPHQCNFGKWYDAFRPESTTLSDYMARFDAPHKRVHAIAVKAQELIRAGKKEQAKELVHSAETGDLGVLLRLFDNVEQQIRTFTYEYAVVMEQQGGKYAFAVDSVRSFETLSLSTEVPDMITRTGGDFVEAIGQRTADGRSEDVLLLNVEKLLLN